MSIHDFVFRDQLFASNTEAFLPYLCVCVCVRACVRACARACVCYDAFADLMYICMSCFIISNSLASAAVIGNTFQ